MSEFMADTDDGKHGPEWWTGKMPAFPHLYEPADWQEANKPICLLWLDYLAELEQMGLTDTFERAQELPIADLLAASREAEAIT